MSLNLNQSQKKTDCGKIYSDFLFYAHGLNQGEIFINHKCNNDCLFCSSANYERSPSFEQVKFQIYQLREQDINRISFTGGEPTENPRLIEAVSLAKRLGFEYIEIKSNGRRYSDNDYLKSLIKAGANSFHIGIHSHLKNIQNRIARKKESFDETVRGLKNLEKNNANVKTCTVINKFNYKGLIFLVKYLEKFRNIYCFSFAYLHPVSSAKEHVMDLAVPLFEVNPHLIKTLEYIKKLNKDMFVDNFPYCLLGGIETCISQMFMSYPSQTVKYPECVHNKKCIYGVFCESINPAYIEMWGWDKTVNCITAKDIKFNDNRDIIYILSKQTEFCINNSVRIRENKNGAILENKDYFIVMNKKGHAVIGDLKAKGRVCLSDISRKKEIIKFFLYLHRLKMINAENPDGKNSKVKYFFPKENKLNPDGQNYIYEYPLRKREFKYPDFKIF